VAKKEEPQEPEWVITNIGLMMYTSLMILLLAFFIMLNALSVRDERREKQALGSLVGTFGILPGGLSPMESESRRISPPSSPLELIKSDTEQMKKVLAFDIVEDKVRVLKGRTRRIIRFQASTFFAPDGVEVFEEAKPKLIELADIMRGGTYLISIEGYTDDQPPKNEALINNWYVSATWAANILRVFLNEGRIDPKRLSAYGYASYSPVAPNNSPENRARNRRIDIVLDVREPIGVEDYEKKSWRPKKFLFRGFSFDLLGNRERP